MRKDQLDTPCLVLDLDAFEENLKTMQDTVSASGKNLRPHAKTHKSSVIAKKQLAMGAIGICTAKISEAEALIGTGIEIILITGPVVTSTKVARLLELLEHSPSLMTIVDHPDNVSALNDALRERNLQMEVLLDIDVGLHRTGVPADRALALADVVLDCDRLCLKGIQAYAGQVQHIPDYQARAEASRASLDTATHIFRTLKAKAPACTILSTSGTGTYDIDLEIPEITELQVGSYVLMDAEYLAIGSKEDADQFSTFHPALRLLTSVVSVNQRGYVTVDAGLKALYRHGGIPRVISPTYESLQYDWFGDEYGRLSANKGQALPELGEAVELVVSHCDPTVNQFDCYYVLRNDEVVDSWPIDLRGKSQ